MSDEYGGDFITLTDDEGNDFELEVIDTIDYNGRTFTAFLPADMDEDDPSYGMVLLENVYEGDEEFFDTIPDDEIEEVYEEFVRVLYADEEEEDE